MGRVIVMVALPYAEERKNHMPLLVPNAGGYMDSRLIEIERSLQQHLDRRLFLTIGRVIDRKRKRVVAEKVEVRWRADDGREHFIGSWSPHEVNRIESDLRILDQTAPGHESSVDRADKHNDAKLREADEQYADTVQRMLDHYTFAKNKT